MTEIRDNRAENRFELEAEGLLAIAEYRRRGDQILFTHTEVPKSLEGKGIGKRLIAGALDQVRAEGLKAVPICPFVAHFIDTHPEAQDLLAQA